MRRHLSTTAELLGLGAVLAAAFLFDWRAGLAIVGAFLLLVGYALDRPAGVIE